MNKHKAILQRLKTQPLNEWEKKFWSSVSEAHTRYGSLTERQGETLEGINEKYTDSAKVEREGWIKNFTPEMREIMVLVAKYYEQEATYYLGTARKVLDDPEFIPSAKQYNAMCRNKYAERVVENWNSEFLYGVTQLVLVRKTSNVYPSLKDTPMVVVEHMPKCLTPGRGTNTYKVLPAGRPTSWTFLESEIKKLR